MILSTKRKKRNYESIAKAKASKGHYNSGRWTRLEHFKFLEALKMFGKEWQKVQQHVYTRTSTQARSHAQKFFVKLDKKHLILTDFLEMLDIEKLRVNLRLADGGDSTEYDEDQVIFDTRKPKNKKAVSNTASSGELAKVVEHEQESHEEAVSPSQAVHLNKEESGKPSSSEIMCEEEPGSAPKIYVLDRGLFQYPKGFETSEIASNAEQIHSN